MATIEQLERDRWPEPDRDVTFVVERCHALRRQPLDGFTVEDMRIMLGQQVGVSALLPRVVELLVREPLTEGDFYPGDLLAAVLLLPASAWSGRSRERQQLVGALARVPAIADARLHQLVEEFLS